jgi:hypothetical protein
MGMPSRGFASVPTGAVFSFVKARRLQGRRWTWEPVQSDYGKARVSGAANHSWSQYTLERESLAALDRVNAFWLMFRPEQTKLRGSRGMNAFSLNAYQDESV